MLRNPFCISYSDSKIKADPKKVSCFYLKQWILVYPKKPIGTRHKIKVNIKETELGDIQQHRELPSMEELLLQNLVTGDAEAQVRAATQLSNLSSKQRHSLAEKGVMLPLISMLHSQDFEANEAALLALLSLAFGSERLVHSSFCTSYSVHNCFTSTSCSITHC